MDLKSEFLSILRKDEEYGQLSDGTLSAVAEYCSRGLLPSEAIRLVARETKDGK